MDNKTGINTTLKLSIVIPMYNSFAVLKRNLHRFNNFKDLEIELILVDDCSTDDSYVSACECARSTSFKIVVIKNEKNGGPGVSRNNGIRHATGDYITFVDSDDYLADDFEDKVKNLMKQNVDCIIFNYLLVSTSEKKLGLGKSIEIPAEEGFISRLDAFVYTFGTTACKVYKRSIIENNKIKFANLFRNEDMPFTKKAISCCEKIFYLPLPLYMYVQHDSSLMHRKELNDEQNCQTAYNLLAESMKEKSLKEEMEAVHLREVLNNSVLVMVKNGDSKSKIIQFIKANYSFNLLKNRYFKRYPRKVKVITFLILCRMVVTLKIGYKYYKCVVHTKYEF